MADIQLVVTNRTQKGKQVRTMRKNGQLPAVVYGENRDSIPVTVDMRDFMRIFAQAGETTVVHLQLDGVSIPVLISETSRDPVSDILVHADFRRVNLKKPIEAQVPVEIVGASPAIKAGGAVLIVHMQEILVKALPTDIPSCINVDVSVLTAIGQEITIADLPKSDMYTIEEEPQLVIATITEHKEQSTEVQSEKVETEITSEKPVVAEGTNAATEEPKK